VRGPCLSPDTVDGFSSTDRPRIFFRSHAARRQPLRATRVACGGWEGDHTHVEMPKPPLEEEELDELPPMDGDDADDDPDADAAAEDLDEEPADGADPMDDSTGEGDPIEEIETSGAEAGWLDDAGDSEALDVGTPETFGTEEEGATLLEGADEPDVGEEDLSIGAEDESNVADAGEEGFADEEEDLREEDLPRLDSDEEDVEPDDSDLLEGLPEEDASEESRPPWDDRAWERVEDGRPTNPAPVTALSIGP
jgi:hypothetical protein